MGPIDHLLALAVAVAVPALSRPPDDETRAMIQGNLELRRALHLQTMLMQWLLASVCLWRIEAQGGTGGSIGLSPAGQEPGLLIGWAFVLAFALWRVVRGPWVLASRSRSAEVLAEARATAPFLPHGRRDGRTWVLLSFTAGLCEEVVYRGYLIAYGMVLAGGELAPPRPDAPLAWASAAVASGAFAGAHLYQGGRQAAKIGVAGAMFGALYLLSGSLWPGIVLHVFVDVHEGWLARELIRRAPLEEPSTP
ncbi:MAG: CPBP family intramembrane glutamic endopeptidase [Planctomycetota bacterium]